MRKFMMILAFLFLSIGIASCTGNQKIMVSFETNGGNEIEDLEISLNSTSVDFPTPTREGFTFIGWYLNSDLSDPFTIAALLTQTGALTLYAKWESNSAEYTMTFETNGGSLVAAITQAEGMAVVAPVNPTKSGFTFGGWYSNSALTTAYTFTTMPAENITVYAKWNAVITTQTITFNSNGGSVVAAMTQDVGSVVNAPANPTKLGHTFGGWYSDSALTTAYTFTTMPNSALTLYAKWNVNSYTISFNTNGGSVIADVTESFGSAVTAPANPTKLGHTFDGWYSDSGLTTAYTFTTMPAQNTTLYAKWTVNNYTISFDENAGSEVINMTQAFGSTVVAPTDPTKDGYTFGGWYSDSGLTTAYQFTTMPAGNITLYAKWNVITYTLTFVNAEGVLPLALAEGATITFPTPTKVGYQFAGWYEDQYFLIPYTGFVMPANDVSICWIWSIT